MIAAKVATVDLVVELNLPLSTLVRINKVFKKSLRIQTLLKGQLKMFLFLVLSSSFLCLLFFFFVIRGRHVCIWDAINKELTLNICKSYFCEQKKIINLLVSHPFQNYLHLVEFLFFIVNFCPSGIIEIGLLFYCC